MTTEHTDVFPVLVGMREILSDPRKWTRYHVARDKFGVGVAAHDPSATCFCLVGAAVRASPSGDMASKAVGYVSAIANRDYFVSATLFNDTHTHSQVLALLDSAIEELGGTL
jgi:hypothetical protein